MLADRYELHALLGAGGMAEVYEATAHGAFGFLRRVAVKRLLTDSTNDDGSVRLFLDEVRIASRLHHAGIVAVLDCGVVDNAPFQVLELVDGWDAAALIRLVRALGQSIPVDIALHISVEVAHALAHAHEATDEHGHPLCIVHRDVKPSNILVSRGGDVKLGDFGIALARERASRTTGLIARGTPPYMAPEQLRRADVDHRADIFSLGCTLHALLTGASPLAEESARALLMSGGKIPLSTSVPERILAVIERAVSAAPSARFATARAMAVALGSELSPLLRADPKSRMREWLDQLGAPPRAPTAVAPSVIIASTRPSTLASTDRVFTSHTAPLAGSSSPPTAHASSPPAPALPAPYGSARSAAHGSIPAPRGSSAPGAIPRTIDSTSPLPAVAPTPTPASRLDARVIFGVALIVPIAIAVIAGVGVVAGHRLSTMGASDAARPAVAPEDAATDAPDAHASTGSAATPAAPPPARAQGSAGARPASPSDAVTPSGLAGTGPPVSNGCTCTAKHEGGVTGVCHPRHAGAPACRCTEPDGNFLCWVPFSAEGDSLSLCPERLRRLPESARDGDACVGLPVGSISTKNAQGQSVRITRTEPARPGRLEGCDRCPGTAPSYPRTPGAPCVGIAPSGARVQGQIECR